VEKLSTAGTTRHRLIEAVERLLSERDDLSVSLREITTAASANVAAVNYHFGSKQALVDTVITRALKGHAEAQLAGLEAAAATRPPAPVEELVWAWMRPTLDVVVEGRPLPITRVAARAVGGGSPHLRRLISTTHSEPHGRLVDLLAERLPEVSREELTFRVTLAVSVGTGLILGSITGGTAIQPSNRDEQAGRAVAFVAAGLSAPPTRAGGRP
jgi:AcrR family transcriptional regulator